MPEAAQAPLPAVASVAVPAAIFRSIDWPYDAATAVAAAVAARLPSLCPTTIRGVFPDFIIHGVCCHGADPIPGRNIAIAPDITVNTVHSTAGLIPRDHPAADINAVKRMAARQAGPEREPAIPVPAFIKGPSAPRSRSISGSGLETNSGLGAPLADRHGQ